MSRVTETEVRNLLGVDDSVEVASAIATATLIVDEELAGIGHTTERLKQIELYLSAHFYTVTRENGGIIERSIGESTERYSFSQSKATGYNLTRFGQQAVSLDTSGILSGSARTSLRAEIRVL